MNQEHDFKIVCKYDMGELLGYGTFSRVYKGMNRNDGRLVAIKKILKNKDNLRDIENWKKEMFVLKILKHPNIISFVEYIELDHVVYLVMEHGGTELYHYVNKQVLSETGVKSIFKQIVSAVKYIHSKGYIHGDIKLENTLINSEGIVKIIDFGMAKYDTGSNMYIFGSPEYLSPEIIKRSDCKLSSGDIWATGVVLYTLLYDDYPFAGESTNEILESICTKEPVYSDKVSNIANELIQLILQKNPKKRPTAKNILKHQWLQGASPL
jgi:5'-AMP-activated protein kinase, catalytic alpha subunit